MQTSACIEAAFMPSRSLVAKELGSLFSVFTHPDRIRIVEELRDGERDVNAIQAALDVTHSRTSQNLAILRAHRLVTERREGRHVYYRLVEPDIARWVLDGLRFIEADLERVHERQSAIEEARQLWTPDASVPEPGS
jgi:DNA-binding transcriptional ArsR family regulator